jgi:tetratricopeptide (TPR) repeat protein
MDDDQSVFSQFLVFPVLIALLAIAWLTAGPGSQLLLESSTTAQSWLNVFADWYQQKLEGSAKLIAPVVTIASGSYAILKAYKFAESRLHYRLQDFVDREEKRLKGAREQLRLSIERPGPERTFRSPIFLAPALKNVMREIGWGSYFLPPQLDYADFQVGSAIDELEKQVKLSKARDSYLNKQLATAHLLKGAMLAAEASKREQHGTEDRGMLTAALKQFTSALKANEDDIEALEYASHMHVRLGQSIEAQQYLDKVIELTNGQEESLPRARALRYLGCIAARNGNNLIAANKFQEAIDTLPVLIGIDRKEEAELYDSLAHCQELLNFVIQAPGNRATAAAILHEVRNAEKSKPNRLTFWNPRPAQVVQN